MTAASFATALTMMITGVAAALIWRHFGLQDAIYEGMPGILAGLAVFGIAEVMRRSLGESLRPRDGIIEEPSQD